MELKKICNLFERSNMLMSPKNLSLKNRRRFTLLYGNVHAQVEYFRKISNLLPLSNSMQGGAIANSLDRSA